MFYEVRILDRKGQLKKVLSANSLSKRYWKSFFEKASGTEALKKPRTKKINKPRRGMIDYKDLYVSDN